MRYLISLSLLLFVITGCDELRQNDPAYKQYYAVESYLIADQPLPKVIVTKTSPFDEKFSFKDNQISDARVQIRLLDKDSTIVERYNYAYSKNGTYLLKGDSLVKPAHWYQLFVTFTSGDTLTARTFVPGSFKATNTLDSSYVYQEDPIQIVTTSSYYPERQSYYILTVKASGTKKDALTPFYLDLVNEKGGWINSYFINSSNITSEGNYPTNKNGNLVIDIPWSVVAFYGKNEVFINAIDQNLHDYWPSRSQSLLSSGMSFSPGEIDKVNYNINGGIGVFGSMAQVSKEVKVLRLATAN